MSGKNSAKTGPAWLHHLSTFIVSLIGGGLAGLLGAFLTYKSLTFQQSLTEHEARVKSFQGQIQSVASRGERKELDRVKKSYERYEEDWRKSRELQEIVAQLKDLPPEQLASAQKTTVRQMLSELDGEHIWTAVPAKTLGDAWLITGDYDKALESYKVVEAQRPQDQENYLSQAKAYVYLSKLTDDPLKRANLNEEAKKKFEVAVKLQPAGTWNPALLNSTFGMLTYDPTPEK